MVKSLLSLLHCYTLWLCRWR